VTLPRSAPGLDPAAATGLTGEPVLRIRELHVEFRAPGRVTTAVSDVSLDVDGGEVVGVVGETGCGKTVTGLSVLRLLPQTALVRATELRFMGRDLLTLPDEEMRRIRGSQIAMVFQNPSSSFNPVFTIGSQMRGVLAAHEGLKGRVADERMREVLTSVALPEPDRVIDAYPHQLSGGMLQRAMLGMALLSRPRLLIADEPTTALDVTIAAQILELLRRLQRELGFSVLFITHDLGVVRRICDRVAVLYAGRVVETAPTPRLFAEPHHPYTRGLMAAVPRAHRAAGTLTTIPGSVPTDPGRIVGCAFRERCALAVERCAVDAPALLTVDAREPVGVDADHHVACHVAGVPADTAAEPVVARRPGL
jgi:oligopeptide/dipeptide ABC transporter ATP-binding protein